MEPTEFLEFLNRSEQEIKKLEKKERNFREKLSAKLVLLVFKYFPELESQRKRLLNSLQDISEQCAKIALECLGSAFHHAKNNIPYTEKKGIRKPRTKEESEKELQELLLLIDEKDHAYLSKIHWEEFENEQRHDGFYFKVHHKIKEVLVEFYFDEIQELSGGHLRLLEHYTYYLAVCEFVDAFYGIKEKEEDDQSSRVGSS